MFIRLSGTTVKVIGRNNEELLIEESKVRFGGKMSHVRMWCIGDKHFQKLKTAIQYANSMLG